MALGHYIPENRLSPKRSSLTESTQTAETIKGSNRTRMERMQRQDARRVVEGREGLRA